MSATEEPIAPLEEPVKPFTDEQITELARDILTNRVFFMWAGDPDLTLAFPILSFMTSCPPNVVGVYEFIDKAGPRSVNGYPSFFSCRFLPEESAEQLGVEYRRMAEALGIKIGGQNDAQR